jgi:hypothetical protein
MNCAGHCIVPLCRVVVQTARLGIRVVGFISRSRRCLRVGCISAQGLDSLYPYLWKLQIYVRAYGVNRWRPEIANSALGSWILVTAVARLSGWAPLMCRTVPAPMSVAACWRLAWDQPTHRAPGCESVHNHIVVCAAVHYSKRPGC